LLYFVAWLVPLSRTINYFRLPVNAENPQHDDDKGIYLYQSEAYTLFRPNDIMVFWVAINFLGRLKTSKSLCGGIRIPLIAFDIAENNYLLKRGLVTFFFRVFFAPLLGSVSEESHIQ